MPHALALFAGLAATCLPPALPVDAASPGVPGAMYQVRGESDSAFIYRVAGRLRDFTRASGFEGCANICRDAAGGQGVLLFTDGTQLGCSLRNGCPVGFELTADSIHSHPQTELITYGKADADLANSRRVLRKVSPGQQSRPISWRFSTDDYLRGPGYLVYGDALLYQRGNGTEHQIGWIPAPCVPPGSPGG